MKNFTYTFLFKTLGYHSQDETFISVTAPNVREAIKKVNIKGRGMIVSPYVNVYKQLTETRQYENRYGYFGSECHEIENSMLIATFITITEHADVNNPDNWTIYPDKDYKGKYVLRKNLKKPGLFDYVSDSRSSGFNDYIYAYVFDTKAEAMKFNTEYHSKTNHWLKYVEV